MDVSSFGGRFVFLMENFKCTSTICTLRANIEIDDSIVNKYAGYLSYVGFWRMCSDIVIAGNVR